MQDDVLFQHFTVREALLFAARLRTKGDCEKRVDKLVGELGLKEVQHSLIGSAARKVISSGERKRTAIGVEIITDPSVVIVDEPTSGLDSWMAVQIVKLLHRLSRQGKTVICTIH